MYCILKNEDTAQATYVAEFTNRISWREEERFRGNIVKLGLSVYVRHNSRTERGWTRNGPETCTGDKADCPLGSLAFRSSGVAVLRAVSIAK